MAMGISLMDAAMLRAFLLGGCNRLGALQEEVNALNVFPVPDGDTGINMYLTVSAAGRKIENVPLASGVGKIASEFSMGALMGARGNSGVILSQIFRGLATSLGSKKTATAEEFAAAMQKGVDLSYKSVMKPVEGTILTVYRLFAAAAAEAAASGADIPQMLRQALQAGEKALADTPRLLPVLKEAGVVDAGGKGLLVFMEGAADTIDSGDLSVFLVDHSGKPASTSAPAQTAGPAAARNDISTADIIYTYCTQLLIKGQDLPIDRIREHLSQDPPGDSLLVVGDETVIKIHFHNNHPGQVLEYCAQFGSLHDIIIDNMCDQHHETMALAGTEAPAAPAAPPQANMEAPLCGVIAVACGEAMSNLFSELGAVVISGGQTMNPSAEDLLNAVEQHPARELVILPNNSNIVLTADQVKQLTEKPVEVVRSKFVTQGISAMLGFNAEHTAAENNKAMTRSCADVISGELTFAVRDTKFNGFSIKQNDLLAIMQGDIVACGQDMLTVLSELIEKMVAASEEPEILSLYYGSDIATGEAEELSEALEERFPDLDLELHAGGQPLYYFLLAVE